MIDVIYTSIPIEVEDNVSAMYNASASEYIVWGEDGCMPGLAIVILPLIEEDR